jgi:uncharacterized protein Yka (UPF0111/DUF47 family)
MSKKNQNVFKQIADSLQKIADNLDDAVTVLYVLGTEMTTLHDEVKVFLEKTSDVVSKPITATVDVEKLAEALTKKRGWGA